MASGATLFSTNSPAAVPWRWIRGHLLRIACLGTLVGFAGRTWCGEKESVHQCARMVAGSLWHCACTAHSTCRCLAAGHIVQVDVQHAWPLHTRNHPNGTQCSPLRQHGHGRAHRCRFDDALTTYKLQLCAHVSTSGCVGQCHARFPEPDVRRG